ncbi:hypothetical protein ACVIGB_000565 [Bradyrhizobium sp. USDA 4341]
MSPSDGALAVELRRRARTLARAARGSLLAIGGPDLEVREDYRDPAAPEVWIRGDVLVVFQVDAIAVSRIADNMTDMDEVASHPAEAVLDATRSAVLDTLCRAVGRQLERDVVGAVS